jgi:hypothetical protein
MPLPGVELTTAPSDSLPLRRPLWMGPLFGPLFAADGGTANGDVLAMLGAPGMRKSRLGERGFVATLVDDVPPLPVSIARGRCDGH